MTGKQKEKAIIFALILMVIGFFLSKNSSAAYTPNFQTFGQTADFKIEVDVSSVRLEPNLGTWNVRSTLKRTLFKQVPVPGSKQKGSFFLDDVTADCVANAVVLNRSVLFSESGKELSVKSSTAIFEDPKVPGNFVTDFLAMMCASASKVKPPLII